MTGNESETPFPFGEISISQQAIRGAADILWDHWINGRRLRDGLPEAVRPLSRIDGYTIQATLELRSHAPLFGWKIAATSEAAQKHLQVDSPMAGRILAERVLQPWDSISLTGNMMRVIEAEFAFRMREDLPALDRPYSVSEVLDAVDSLHPAIEIPDSRFEDSRSVGAAQFIADNSCAHQFVLGGPAQVGWRSLNLIAQQVKATVVGKLERIGTGAAVLGDPRVALTWLANELAALGTPLKARQVVATGTCMKPLPIAPGDEVTVDFGPLGSISIRAAT